MKTDRDVGGVSGFMSIINNFKPKYFDEYKNDSIDENENTKQSAFEKILIKFY